MPPKLAANVEAVWRVDLRTVDDQSHADRRRWIAFRMVGRMRFACLRRSVFGGVQRFDQTLIDVRSRVRSGIERRHSFGLFGCYQHRSHRRRRRRPLRRIGRVHVHFATQDARFLH